jgi:3-deoxy-7-phosphoheptulonate synthase
MANMRTYDVNVLRFEGLVSPEVLKDELPMSTRSTETVLRGRRAIEAIITKQDPRLLVIAGPCSIHDPRAALEYGRRLSILQNKVHDTIFLAMRVYFEKPRTTVGWKGLISDPYLDGSYDMATGLRMARDILRQLTDMGVPTATEFLDPVTPQYIAGLVCWAAIGARTTESQTHREMASGLSSPVGFKNGTDGGLETAINAMIAASSPQCFLGMAPNGMTSIVHTKGNPYTHIVLRGGQRPNYDSVSIREAESLLKDKGLHQAIIVDCSHSNSRKRFAEQTVVWEDVINQRFSGNTNIIGLMLESHLKEGRQENNGNPKVLAYGQSITDACISWEATEAMILSTAQRLSKVKAQKE